MIPSLAWMLFLLVPLGGMLLAVGIRTVRGSFLGPLLAEVAIADGPATFELFSPGVFGLWQKAPRFQRTPLESITPVVIDEATGASVTLQPSVFRPRWNDGITAWWEFQRFVAGPGRYRLELRPGSGIPTAVERALLPLVPLPAADPARCTIQVRASESAARLAVGIPLLVLAGMLMIGGLVGGILAATVGR